MENSSRIWIAAIFIAVGFIFLIDQLGFLVPLGLTAGWFISLLWPLLIFSLGIYLFYRRSYIFGFIFSYFGLGLLISTITGWSFWGTFWPLIIIGIGMIILFREGDEKSSRPAPSSEKTPKKYAQNIDDIDEVVVFSAKEKQINSKKFSGGKATSIFGGMKLDLSDIQLDKDGAELDVASIFGSLKIYVPKNIKVETSGTPILGSWENKFKSESKAKNKVLQIKGAAIFGSVEIIN